MIKHEGNIEKSELHGRFKDNIAIWVDNEGWPFIKLNSDSVWNSATFNTETDDRGNTFYVFTQIANAEYADGYNGKRSNQNAN